MRKLKLQMQMTVDGYVAGPNDEMDWMVWGDPDIELETHVNGLIDTSDTILLGRKMTEGFVNYWTDVVNNQPDSREFSFAKRMVDTPKVVFTETLEESPWDNTRLATGDLVDEVNRLKNQEGKDILVYGGAALVSSLIEANLIDEYHLAINPAALGKGKAIFKGRQNLTLVKSQALNSGEVQLCYVPR